MGNSLHNVDTALADEHVLFSRLVKCWLARGAVVSDKMGTIASAFVVGMDYSLHGAITNKL